MEKNLLAEAVRDILLRNYDLPEADRLTLGVVANELEYLTKSIATAKGYVVTTIESDSVAEVSSATDRLVQWAMTERM